MKKMTTIQISIDQNKIIINDRLSLDFFPVNRVKKTHCNYCWLLRGITGFDCQNKLPCRSSRRLDKKDGVFSIREMPLFNYVTN